MAAPTGRTARHLEYYGNTISKGQAICLFRQTACGQSVICGCNTFLLNQYFLTVRSCDHKLYLSSYTSKLQVNPRCVERRVSAPIKYLLGIACHNVHTCITSRIMVHRSFEAVRPFSEKISTYCGNDLGPNHVVTPPRWWLGIKERRTAPCFYHAVTRKVQPQ